MDADFYEDSYEDEYYPEWLDDEELDEDQLAELMGAYGDEYSPEYGAISFQQLLEQCVLPSITQTAQSLLLLLISCIVFRMVCALRYNPGEREIGLPLWGVHFSSGCFGLFVLHTFFKNAFIYFIISAGILYAVILLLFYWRKQMCGLFVSSAVVIYILFCELYLMDGVLWHSIRGISKQEIYNKLDSTVYNLTELSLPGKCRNIIHSSPKSFSWIISLISSGVLSVMCLIYSSCFSQWLILDSNNKWILAYRDAQAFRFSHYFVSFTSQATALLCGLGSTASNGDTKWNKNVTRPFHIELPRSLVEVVTNWNLPMHYWLKNYVFKTVKPIGTFAAVLMTYAASSLLHGLNFQLASVLFSLGFYSYVEYVLRNRLSKIYSACIKAKRCNENCDHTYKWNNPIVIVVNLGFGLLTVYHLAYLGLMFDSSAEQQKGYTMEHTLSKWSSLNFASHWVALGTFVIYWLI